VTAAVRETPVGWEPTTALGWRPSSIGEVGSLLVDLALEATVGLSFSRVGFEVRRRIWSWAEPPEASLAGQVAVVTGATSGLGLALATRFAELGASVVVVGRDPTRIADARAAIARETGAGTVSSVRCDLARLDDVRALADELRRDHGRIDVLVHNAGALVHDFERTVDGMELTAQAHVVAPFLLTAEVLDLLRATPGARVLTVASGGMYTTALGDLDPAPAAFDGVRTYARAKRAQVVLNEEWARRHGEVARFDAMHPGWVDTPGLRASLPGFSRLGRLLRTPDQGVDTLVWLATAPIDGNGGFWLDRRRRWTSKLPWTRTTPAAAGELWDWARRRSGAMA
jgi:dehydrogenase/reductase SDR family member 12